MQSGANELADGLQQLSKNSAALNEGAQTVFNTLLGRRRFPAGRRRLQTPKLTIDNYAKVLDQILASLSEEAVRKTADAAALEKVTAAVNAQESAVRAKYSGCSKPRAWRRCCKRCIRPSPWSVRAGPQGGTGRG